VRLPQTLRTRLLAAVRASYGDIPVYLYGSRTDDLKKGGDIDLALSCNIPATEFQSKRIAILMQLTRQDFELPVDIVQYSNTMDPLLKSEIDSQGILLVP
jgi:predicted nucleotidyltransferase